MRFALAALMALHGIAHLVGFASPWGLVSAGEFPRDTTIAGSAIDLGEVGIRIYGLLWLLVAGAFVGAAVALATRNPAWHTATLAVVAASTVLCLLSLPAARLGLVVNVAIILCVVVGAPRGWFPPHT